MRTAFASIAFTPSVRRAQARYGSAGRYAEPEPGTDLEARLTDREAAFIAGRDGFYQATVSETGWPYVQYRGGPAGFLRVLDSRTLGYADFRGNVQYVSVGNLAANDRVALILMDYAHRQRLKLWGLATVIDAADDPGLMERLEVPGYGARVERGIVIRVAAWDWNCPQHITRRWTEAELEPVIGRLQARIAELEAGRTPPTGGGEREPGP